MKAKHPDVSVLLSIGGWVETKWFSEMAVTAEGRASFIGSCVETLKSNAFLGGVDIDWEYPGVARNGEGIGYIGNEADEDNFTALLREMRVAFDNTGLSGKVITFCAPSNTLWLKSGKAAIDFAAVAAFVDRVNIMSYDMATSDTMKGMHQSALFPDSFVQEGSSASESAQYIIDMGVPPGKINIGTPLYSQGWVIPSGIDSGGGEEIAAGALGQAAIAPGYGLLAPGCMYWYTLKAMENTPGWVKGFDETAKAAYLYNIDPNSAQYRQFYSYESDQSLEAKLDYINANGLGGLIVWCTPGDGYSCPMITQMAKGLGIYRGDIPVYEPGPYIP